MVWPGGGAVWSCRRVQGRPARGRATAGRARVHDFVRGRVVAARRGARRGSGRSSGRGAASNRGRSQRRGRGAGQLRVRACPGAGRACDADRRPPSLLPPPSPPPTLSGDSFARVSRPVAARRRAARPLTHPAAARALPARARGFPGWAGSSRSPIARRPRSLPLPRRRIRARSPRRVVPRRRRERRVGRRAERCALCARAQKNSKESGGRDRETGGKGERELRRPVRKRKLKRKHPPS